MELELCVSKEENALSIYYIIPIWNWSNLPCTTVLVPSFLLHYSYMELEQYETFCLFCYFKITLFLYGIGAIKGGFGMIFLTGLHYSYMELELISKSVVSMSKNYYIIPIWNWSV